MLKRQAEALLLNATNKAASVLAARKMLQTRRDLLAASAALDDLCALADAVADATEVHLPTSPAGPFSLARGLPHSSRLAADVCHQQQQQRHAVQSRSSSAPSHCFAEASRALVVVVLGVLGCDSTIRCHGS